jgi:hypothetical protein
MNYILLAAIIIAAITSVAAIEAMPCTYEDRLDDMIHTTGGSSLTKRLAFLQNRLQAAAAVRIGKRIGKHRSKKLQQLS